MPNAAIRNLIREDKVHQIYSAMQTGQEKFGMLTFNQSLAQLYLARQISLEEALNRSSMKDELREIINRAGGNLAQAPRQRPVAAPAGLVGKG
jgi:twitching motility protein PilT